MRELRGERYAEVDGLRVRYLEAGAGPAVLFLHGASTGSSAEVWEDVFQPLAGAGYRPIAYDQPGYGLTDNPTDFTNSYRARFITKVMDALAIDRATLVGHSQAGGFALQTAVQQPDRVAALAIVSSGPLLPPLPDANGAAAPERTGRADSGDPSLEDVRRLMESEVFHKSLITSALVERRHRLSVGKNRVAAAERSRAREPRAEGKPPWQQLAELKLPLVMLYGENDRAAAGQRARLLKEQQPQLDVRVLPEAAHSQVAAFDGPFAPRSSRLSAQEPGPGAEDMSDLPGWDLDYEEAEPASGFTALRLILIADPDEDQRVAAQRAAVTELAGQRGVGISELAMDGEHPLVRLAGVIQLADYASVYLAIASGIDPGQTVAIRDLRIRIE